MIDVLILFLVFYFLLYKRALKKFGDDPKKSVWVRWFRRHEGTSFDSLFAKNQKNQVPIVKCMLLAGVFKILLYIPGFFYIDHLQMKHTDPHYIKEVDRSWWVGMSIHCNLCAPILVPTLLYVNQQRKENPEEMFLYKYKKRKNKCLNSDFKHYSCNSLFTMALKAGDEKTIKNIAQILINRSDSVDEKCRLAGSTSRHFFEKKNWDKFVLFGRKACEHGKETYDCKNYCEIFEVYQELGTEDMKLRDDPERDETWSWYPIPKDFKVEIEDLDQYL